MYIFAVEVSEDPRLGKDPLHKAGLSMYALEGRVDYMGSSILMTRLSDMTLTLRDEWKIDKVQDADAPLATTRSVWELHLSRVVRKPAFCICENKDADQLHSKREADQRLCFRYIDSTIPLVPIYEISSL